MVMRQILSQAQSVSVIYPPRLLLGCDRNNPASARTGLYGEGTPILLLAN